MGMNPVTFRGEGSDPQSGKATGPAAVSMGRAHFGIGGIQKKVVQFIIFDKEEESDDENPPRMLGAVQVEEEKVIEGLKLLFPNGELAQGQEALFREALEGFARTLYDYVVKHECKEHAEAAIEQVWEKLGLIRNENGEWVKK